MREYHKIDTIFKRDPQNLKRIVEGDFSQDAFAYLVGNEWIFTEKVDGTNIRVIVDDGRVRFGGKTDNASIPAKLIDCLRDRFLPQQSAMLDMFPEGACLYGEGYGAKIQSGGNYRPDQDFVLFDVLIGEWWLHRDAIEDIASKLGLDVVPIIGTGSLADAVSLTRAGFPSRWGSFIAEGIVARPAVELKTRNGRRVITKIKHRDFDHSATTDVVKPDDVRPPTRRST